MHHTFDLLLLLASSLLVAFGLTGRTERNLRAAFPEKDTHLKRLFMMHEERFGLDENKREFFSAGADAERTNEARKRAVGRRASSSSSTSSTKRGTVVIEGTYHTNLRWCYHRCVALDNCTGFIYQVPGAACILQWDTDQMGHWFSASALTLNLTPFLRVPFYSCSICIVLYCILYCRASGFLCVLYKDAQIIMILNYAIFENAC